MTVHHHLDDATLLRYASGGLDEAFSTIVAAHLAMCEDCRRALRLAEEVGGQLLKSNEPADLAEDAFVRLMQRIDNTGEAVSLGESKHAVVVHSDVPAPLQRFIGTSLDDVSWKTVAPGIRKHTIALPSKTASSLYMLHIAEGKAVPEHGHGGAEITLVLSGAYRDELGRFGPGDIADLDEHCEHQPKVEPGSPCICLVATEAPTRFKGLISRLLQPLVGI